ncbi:MAG: protealysin inhibitor emfourin [Acidimicrobiia bacterium]
MKVRLERSGGIAGLTMVAEVDTDAPGCAPDLADHARAALSVKAPRRRRPAGAADRFQYDLVMDEAGATKRFSFGESDMPAALEPLVRALIPLARPARAR